MKLFFRTFALIIALVMLLSVVASCDKGGADVDDNGVENATTTVVTTEPEATEEGGSEEVKRDFNGRTFTVLGRDGSNTAIGKNFEIVGDEDSMDRVSEAVFLRNEKLKRDYNFEIAQELVPNIATAARTDYLSENSKYDVVIYQPQVAVQHASDVFLLNLYDLESLDFSHKAFSEKTNSQLTVGGKLFATTSAFLLQDKSAMNLLYYNTELARSAVSFDIEQAVAENSWNIESFYKAMRDTVDADSNKKGLVANSSASAGAFIHGMGFDTFVREGDNTEIISELGAAELAFFDKVDKLLFDASLSEIPSSVIGADGNANRDTFCAGSSLFYAGVVHDIYSGSISRECEFDIGILPFPKLDAEQQEYRNFAYGDTSVFAVPASAAVPNDSAFFLQVISEYSLDTTYKAYLETCQLRLTSVDGYDMLKMALDSVHYDIVSAINPKNFYLSFLNCFHNGTSVERYWQSSLDAQAYFGQLEQSLSEQKKYVPED